MDARGSRASGDYTCWMRCGHSYNQEEEEFDPLTFSAKGEFSKGTPYLFASHRVIERYHLPIRNAPHSEWEDGTFPLTDFHLLAYLE